MAGVEGIEPSQSVLETDVLPLNYTPLYTAGIVKIKLTKNGGHSGTRTPDHPVMSREL